MELTVMYYIFCFAFTFYISFYHWPYILAACAVIIDLPNIIHLIFLFALMVFCAKISDVKKQKFSIWYYRFLKIRTKFWKKLYKVEKFILNFIGGSSDMAITLREVGEDIPYVPDSEEGEDNPTTFYFQKKPRPEIVDKKDELVELGDGGSVRKIRSSTVAYELTLHQLSGWENLKDKNGEVVPFPEGDGDDVETKKKNVYDQLPIQIQDELESEFGGGLQDREQNQVDQET